MELFRTVQKNFAFLGITPAQSIRKNPFNREIALAYFVYGVGWTSSVAYLYRNANTFEECTIVIYVVSVGTVILLCFNVVVFRISKLFEFISDCRESINQSECISIIQRTICVPLFHTHSMLLVLQFQ